MDLKYNLAFLPFFFPSKVAHGYCYLATHKQILYSTEFFVVFIDEKFSPRLFNTFLRAR